MKALFLPHEATSLVLCLNHHDGVQSSRSFGGVSFGCTGFCIMEDSVTFEDYLLGGMHEGFVKDIDHRQWVQKKAIMERCLWTLREHR